jgi:hypothetical protein
MAVAAADSIVYERIYGVLCNACPMAAVGTLSRHIVSLFFLAMPSKVLLGPPPGFFDFSSKIDIAYL